MLHVLNSTPDSMHTLPPLVKRSNCSRCHMICSYTCMQPLMLRFPSVSHESFRNWIPLLIGISRRLHKVSLAITVYLLYPRMDCSECAQSCGVTFDNTVSFSDYIKRMYEWTYFTTRRNCSVPRTILYSRLSLATAWFLAYMYTVFLVVKHSRCRLYIRELHELQFIPGPLVRIRKTTHK